MKKRRISFFFLVLFFFGTAQANGSQPFIDSVKNDLPQREESASFIDEIKSELDPDTSESEGYTEAAKRKILEEDADRKRLGNADGYSEIIRSELPTGQVGGAIDALHEGRSELKAFRGGKVRNAFGINIGAMTRKNWSLAGRNFSSMYPTVRTAPDPHFFYEYQLFHSVWFGSLGIRGDVGLVFDQAKGYFVHELFNPVTSESFGTESPVWFTFVTVPVSTGLIYRFNLLRLLRPYASVSPAFIGYSEFRSDGVRDRRGYSTALKTSVGVAILLDWIWGSAAWDLYEVHGVKHYYLTAEWVQWIPLTGPMRFTHSGLYAGATFEY